jgi:hypothetical protein
MAQLAHLTREIIITAFATDRGRQDYQASETLKGWRQVFAEVLIAKLAHYQQIVVGYHGCRALRETLRLMDEVDAVVGEWQIG